MQEQYSAMESTVAQFQETGNMLTQLLEQKINLLKFDQLFFSYIV